MTNHKINIDKAVYSVKQREDGTFSAHNCSTLREVKSENTMRKIFKALTERDHAAALEMNAELDAKAGHLRWCEFIGSNDYPARRAIIGAAHTEALAFNEQFDFFNNPGWQRQLVAKAHREALEMNAETDRRHHLAVMVSIQNTIMERDDLPALVEACHAEALKMDEAHDASYRSVSRPGCFEGLGFNQKSRAVVAAHAEALELNSAMDHIIDERQQISDCEYDERTEHARLSAMRDHYLAKPVFKDVYQQALWLWNLGYVTSLYDGMNVLEEYQQHVRLDRAAWVVR